MTPRKGCAPQVRTTVLGTQKDWTTVGEVHTAGDMTNAYQYGYQGHAATHIGVAESGDDVSFSISGSHYEDNGATALWPAVGSGIGKRATTRFKYQHVRTVYVCLGRTVYSKESVQWNGDTAWGATNHTLDGHCSGTGRTARYLPHTTFIKDKGKGVTWSVGVTAFGVGLTTESDWSNNVRSTWHFGNNYPQYYLCGDTAGPVFAQRVFAGL